MADKKCEGCYSLSATTERSRANGLSPLALCNRCAAIWDQAITATANAAPEPLDDQVRTLFEAVRYLVDNMLPQTMADHAIKTQLVEELDTVINLGEVT